MDHRTRGEKEEALEERVIERVQRGPGEAEHRNHRVSVRKAQGPSPYAHQNDPDVLYAMEREEPLDIMLREGPHDSQHARNRAEREYDPSPPRRRRAEQEDGTEQPVDPHLDDDTRHQGRDVRRRRGVGLGQPEVEGDGARLETERDQRHRQDHPASARRERRVGGEGVKAQITRSARPDRKEGEQEQRAHVGRDDIDHPGPADLAALVLEHNQQIRRHGHHFPGDEERQRRARDHGEGEAGHENGQQQVSCADCTPPALVCEVGQSVKPARGAHAQNRQEKDRRECVEAEHPRTERCRRRQAHVGHRVAG